MAVKPSTKKKPARPHHRTALGQAQREKTRTLIVRSAIPVFAELGPDAPVIDDFVKAAGVSRGTFYNYFQTTRELLEATLETLSDEVIADIVPAVQDLRDPVTRMATAARLYYRKATHDPQFRALQGAATLVGHMALEHVKGDLEEAMRAGLLKVQDIELAQAVAVGVMVFALKTSAAQTSNDAHGTEVVRAILSGLGVAPARIERALRLELPKVERRQTAVA